MSENVKSALYFNVLNMKDHSYQASVVCLLYFIHANAIKKSEHRSGQCLFQILLPRETIPISVVFHEIFSSPVPTIFGRTHLYF